MARPDPFGEHVGVMKALYQEYTKQDDIEAMNMISSIANEMQHYAHSKDQAVKDIIKELTTRVSALQASCVYPHPEGHHERRVAALEADIRDIKDNMKQLSTTAQDAEQHKLALKQRATAAEARAKEVVQQLQQEEDHLRGQLALYAHISKITWKLDAQPGTAAGTVSNPDTSEIITFEEDLEQTGHFEMVNKFWGMLSA